MTSRTTELSYAGIAGDTLESRITQLERDVVSLRRHLGVWRVAAVGMFGFFVVLLCLFAYLLPKIVRVI